MKTTPFHFTLLLSLVLCLSCTQDLSQCGNAPPLELDTVLAKRRGATSGQHAAALVVPNPFDVARDANFLVSDVTVGSLMTDFALKGILGASALENEFIKIRTNATAQSTDLVQPGSSTLDFDFSSSEYSQTMAYYSISTIVDYVEALGFPLQSRSPLFVLTDSPALYEGEVNAFYEHHHVNPEGRNVIRLVGNDQNTKYPPSKDRDMYWHEFGHHLNEVISGDVRIDYAVDNGALYTEGAALHECTADYIMQSLGDKNYIGRWIGANFTDAPSGASLRSSVDGSTVLQFEDVSVADGSGLQPERYQVAEWCSRVLWSLRRQFVSDNPETGAAFADRLVLSSISLLSTDTSLEQFRQALVEADKKLHCGVHSQTINHAFESRGFPIDGPPLSLPLEVAAEPIGIGEEGQVVALTSGTEFRFVMSITNPNRVAARNVRIRLEPLDGGLNALTYMQAYGDLLPGQKLIIGLEGTGLPLDYSVSGSVDPQVAYASGLRYRLRALVENGPETHFSGVMP